MVSGLEDVEASGWIVGGGLLSFCPSAAGERLTASGQNYQRVCKNRAEAGEAGEDIAKQLTRDFLDRSVAD